MRCHGSAAPEHAEAAKQQVADGTPAAGAPEFSLHRRRLCRTALCAAAGN